ncbi:mononuclear molybdenum enzyme YedY, partial [Burkholderia pseudomallei]
MLMKKTLRAAPAGADISRSETTPRAGLEQRRRILQAAGAAAAGGLVGARGRALAAAASPAGAAGQRAGRRT